MRKKNESLRGSEVKLFSGQSSVRDMTTPKRKKIADDMRISNCETDGKFEYNSTS